MIVYPLRFLLRITAPRPSDFDMDQDVDWDDLGIFAANWLRDDCGIADWCAGADLDMSTEVNFFDYAEFTRCWSGP